jgi:hypothetical protein
VRFTGGDLAGARRALITASEVMNTPGGGEIRGYGSLVVQESLKRFKGEPFEKAMVDAYVGMLSWLEGDAEGAKVGLARAILADKASAPGGRDDFALADYLRGMLARAQGDQDTFRIGLARAREAWPGNPYLDPARAAEANLVVVLEVGRGPQKVAEGLWGYDAAFVAGRNPWSGAVVWVAGGPGGRASAVLDLLAQARTRGRSPREAVQMAKAGVKTGALVTAAVSRDWRVSLIALLVGLFYPAQADTRQLALLPAYVLIWSGKAPAGAVEVRAEFTGPAGGGMVWKDVRVYENAITLVWGRAGHGPIVNRPGAMRAEGKRGENDENQD